MKKVRVFPKLVPREKKRDANPPGLFVFCEKTTGVAQFRTESNADIDCTLERIAGLLAVQCLVRGQSPGDFEIMVPAEKAFVDRLVLRTKELLDSGRAIGCLAPLSPRQKEVLQSVLCNRANKEIASKLNITVRTVKFHISTLLSKFGVQTRAELARRATGIFRPIVLDGDNEEAPVMDRLAKDSRRQGLRPVAVNTTLRVTSKARAVRFPGQILTAS